MYEPNDKANPKYIVFAKIDPHTIPGVGLKCVLSTLAVILVGALLVVATGLWTQQVNIEVPASDQLMATEALKYERVSVVYSEATNLQKEFAKNVAPSAEEKKQAAEVESTIARCRIQLGSVTDRSLDKLLLDAKEHGITANSSDEELAAMVDKTTYATEEVFPGWMRAAVLVVLPAVLAIALTLEFSGVSGVSSIAAWIAYHRSTHNYIYQRENANE